jgi:hypothetical protein
MQPQQPFKQVLIAGIGASVDAAASVTESALDQLKRLS